MKPLRPALVLFVEKYVWILLAWCVIIAHQSKNGDCSKRQLLIVRVLQDGREQLPAPVTKKKKKKKEVISEAAAKPTPCVTPTRCVYSGSRSCAT